MRLEFVSLPYVARVCYYKVACMNERLGRMHRTAESGTRLQMGVLAGDAHVTSLVACRRSATFLSPLRLSLLSSLLCVFRIGLPPGM